MHVRNYRGLQVWQRAMMLGKKVYHVASKFPKEELYGLTLQLKRSVVSVPSNLAEGCMRDSTKDFIKFISISRGSLAEVETQILLAIDLGFIPKIQSQPLLQETNEIGKMLTQLQKKLSQKINSYSAP